VELLSLEKQQFQFVKLVSQFIQFGELIVSFA